MLFAATAVATQVDAYEQGRPSYPAAAVDYALDTLQLRTGRKTVVDLAAGTGKLTRSVLFSCCNHRMCVHASAMRPCLPTVLSPKCMPTCRLLAEHANLDITAVEPNEAMIEGFRSAVPGVPILQGTAQKLPFPDACIDIVFIGQVRLPVKSILHTSRHLGEHPSKAWCLDSATGENLIAAWETASLLHNMTAY